MIYLRSLQELKKMKKSGALLASSFLEIFELFRPGITTSEIDEKVESLIVSGNAKPAFKGYPGNGNGSFPAATCISIDEEVVHGIPSQRKLEDGMIVGVDAGLIIDGWYADMACSFVVGGINEEKKRLCKNTKEALYKGINAARCGNSLEDIGSSIQMHVESGGFSVIRDLVGHGIGRRLHEEPQVPNYKQKKPRVKLKAGMTIAIEPMVSCGNWRIRVLDDGWTATTIDKSPSGHFEHTIAVTDGDPEILTLLPDGSDPWDLL